MTGGGRRQGRFELPAGLKSYRSIGPFDTDSLPKGLLREHTIKEGTWARLSVHSGEIRFVWDNADHQGETQIVSAGAMIVVPPTVPHHLEKTDGDFELTVDFLAQAL
jgi:tellurite resistance-related uncharacterized protein